VRDSSFGRALVNRSRVFRRLKETNSELTEPSGYELSLKTQEYEEKSMPKPALPKIIRTKYFREQEQMERIKSERNVNKLEVIRGINRYEMGCVVGRGSYSVVRAAKSDDGKSFAIKTYGKTKLTDSDKR
jgi:predicted transcriptional regulator